MTQSIKEIEQILNSIDTDDDPRLNEWKRDSRKGVTKLLKSFNLKMKKKHELHKKFTEMQVFEKEARMKNYTIVAGIDEVGRGPLAGPVVAAAVVLPETFYLPGLDDSKKLSDNRKSFLYEEIQKKAVSIGIGYAEAKEIDDVNIYQATKLAMSRAIEDLDIVPQMLLIDAMALETNIPQESIIKGDARSISIAAASVVAKVTRDRYMGKLAKSHPHYKFEKNAGYGTREHLEGLQSHGPCIEHRMSFAPVKTLKN
ncbi:ribonuclease HII [Jeotgalibacillus campisalis]|uniref:Ribonuclease HII n=1 Tax=Jeotgalibacillus campisalis TaxID=220754 RepID=A0A0C2VUL5_9BACL|nr:ribonuclease HII [Jeotgalibacillus campisalis]KIL47698.1 ribonuclease H [Jeotgalibacillus campisalis]